MYLYVSRFSYLEFKTLKKEHNILIFCLFLVTPIRNAAKPNGFLIKDFTVEKNSDTNWTISLLPANCGSPLPLLAVKDSIRMENGDASRATYTKDGLTSSVLVRQEQEASPPIEGTFDIIYNGTLITGGYYVLVYGPICE